MKTAREHHFTGIIPARYSSTRFPGKSLARIGNKTVIRMVYEKASSELPYVCVATDDSRIMDEIMSFGGNAVMTSSTHMSGTDRCAEAAEIIERETGRDAGIIINVQGDEPFIRPGQIRLLMECFNDPGVEIATLIRAVKAEEDLFNTNHPKVVISAAGDAIYFSRSVIPFLRNETDTTAWTSRHTFYKHLGVYGYRRQTLMKLVKLPQSSLEIAESLEQNRWIESGFRIRTAITDWESIGIDTPEDLEKAKAYFDSVSREK